MSNCEATSWGPVVTKFDGLQKSFDSDNRNTYKTNSNTKIKILMSENIGQRRLNFSLEHFDALLYHHF